MHHQEQVVADLDNLETIIGLDYVHTHLAANISSAPAAPAADAPNADRILSALRRHQDPPAP